MCDQQGFGLRKGGGEGHVHCHAALGCPTLELQWALHTWSGAALSLAHGGPCVHSHCVLGYLVPGLQLLSCLPTLPGLEASPLPLTGSAAPGEADSVC